MWSLSIKRMLSAALAIACSMQSLAGPLPAGFRMLNIGDSLSAVRGRGGLIEKGGRGCHYGNFSVKSTDPWSAVPNRTTVEVAFTGTAGDDDAVWIIVPVEAEHAGPLLRQLVEKLGDLELRVKDGTLRWSSNKYFWALTPGPTRWRFEIGDIAKIIACDRPTDFVIQPESTN